LDDIEDKFAYRGDYGAGLNLTEEKEDKLKILQAHFVDYINKYINKQTNKQTRCFAYTDIDGIPGYPVFWDFRYILFIGADEIIFIYGSTSG